MSPEMWLQARDQIGALLRDAERGLSTREVCDHGPIVFEAVPCYRKDHAPGPMYSILSLSIECDGEQHHIRRRMKNTEAARLLTEMARAGLVKKIRFDTDRRSFWLWVGPRTSTSMLEEMFANTGDAEEGTEG